MEKNTRKEGNPDLFMISREPVKGRDSFDRGDRKRPDAECHFQNTNNDNTSEFKEFVIECLALLFLALRNILSAKYITRALSQRSSNALATFCAL